MTDTSVYHPKYFQTYINYFEHLLEDKIKKSAFNYMTEFHETPKIFESKQIQFISSNY